MANLRWLINPIIQNWVTILITSLVTLLAAGISNYGVKRRFKSAKDKDRQRALEELRTAIENLVINNREKIGTEEVDLEKLGLSSERIEDIIDAAEREHQVSLSESATPISLLQDVDLRIKNSRYLDPEQKVQYSAAITEITNEIREETDQDLVLPEESVEIIDSIQENAEYSGHKEDIQRLRKNITTYDSMSSSSEAFETARRMLVFATAMITGLFTLIISARTQETQAPPEFVVILISAVTVVTFSFIFLQFSPIDDDDVIKFAELLFK